MNGIIKASLLSSSLLYSSPVKPRMNSSSSPGLFSSRAKPLCFTCNCSFGPVVPGGENESSKNNNIIDSFFLGKALSEAVTQRIESTVGEFLSTVGRLQSEQQKQFEDFQEEVLERAKLGKEKAAQGLIVPNSSSARDTASGTEINSQHVDLDSEDGSNQQGH